MRKENRIAVKVIDHRRNEVMVVREMRQMTEKFFPHLIRELLPLVNLEGIGRVRGRGLYNAGFRTLKDINNAKIEDLLQVSTIGKSVAENIKKQVENSK